MQEQKVGKEWNYDELDEIYFKKSENELDCLKTQRGMSRNTMEGMTPLIAKTYGGKSKFIKEIQQCLNWKQPNNNNLGSVYQKLIQIGHQPQVIELNKNNVRYAKRWARDNSAFQITPQKLKIKEDDEF